MKPIIKKTLKISLRTIVSILLIAVLAVLVTGVSLVYDYGDSSPFSGPDIYNPYRNLDSVNCWKRANFHTHTRVHGLINECKYWPADTDDAYRKLGYDIVTFSNHNELTVHPYDSTLQVNVYEHGYNLFKYHKLVFGSDNVDRFDHLIPLFGFQKQFQLDRLSKGSDFIQLNHPLRTWGFTKDQFINLEGFRIMELDSGKSTENEYWDWSLSSGHYSFGLANDDLHYPDISSCIAKRSNFLCTPSPTYEDLKRILLEGGYYSMRTPDYGNGDWNVKYIANRYLPAISTIGLKPEGTIFISLTEKADSIKATGQNHTTLTLATDTTYADYTMTPADTYARFTAYFPGGEVIYSNPFARYDAAKADSPFRESSHTTNIPFSILYNFILLLMCVGDLYLIYRLFHS